MPDLSTVALSIVTAGGGAWGGAILQGWWKSRETRSKASIDADVAVEKHRDNLTIEIIKQAGAEVSAARAEVLAVRQELHDERRESAALRAMMNSLAHFDESLDHIENMLKASGDEEIAASQRRARAFLNRMRRLADARGTMANEVQIIQSKDDMDRRQSGP